MTTPNEYPKWPSQMNTLSDHPKMTTLNDHIKWPTRMSTLNGCHKLVPCFPNFCVVLWPTSSLVSSSADFRRVYGLSGSIYVLKLDNLNWSLASRFFSERSIWWHMTEKYSSVWAKVLLSLLSVRQGVSLTFVLFWFLFSKSVWLGISMQLALFGSVAEKKNNRASPSRTSDVDFDIVNSSCKFVMCM